ncbi:hypothetical protein H4219_000290 [Mycoemilia scoparia]|uniref:Prolyl 4-hydroxylase alpha subunit domain-containing protein n=1 Tax=Mycoemilia scoparia TaxID=417184 RepID=A0A9W8AC69_9FUNG|nr:hypothetical protein H4219_000290 [Mycoemilia scoparia]
MVKGNSTKSSRKKADSEKRGDNESIKASKWPTLKTKKQLSLKEYVTDHIFVVENLFTPQECQDLISYAESKLIFPQVPSKVVTRKGEAFRNNSRISISDPGYANELWKSTGLDKLLSHWKTSDGKKVPVGLNDNIRLYRYGPGQQFGRHYDDHSFDYLKRRTEFTLLVYLNSVGDVPSDGDPEAFQKSSDVRRSERLSSKSPKSVVKKGGGCGGETVFYLNNPRQDVRITPEVGKALLHKHGSDCILHESVPVIKGYKYLLRSDVVFDFPPS